MTKILVIEDEEIVAESLKDILEASGYSVPAVLSRGEEALVRIEEFKPDVVVLDIKLNGSIDGVETAQLIRKEHQLPILFLTSDNDLEKFEKAKLIEPEGFILKPFNEKSLRTNIELAIYKNSSEKKINESQRRLADTLLNFQMRAEELLYDREQKFRTLFEQSPVGIFLSTPNGNLLEINPALASMMGYGKATDAFLDIHDISIDMFVNKDDYTRYAKCLSDTDTTRKFEAYLKKKDDGRFIGSVNLKVVFNRNNQVIYHIGHVEDITEHKLLEDAYFSVVDHSLQGIAIFQDRTIVFANRKFTEITGYTVSYKISEKEFDCLESIEFSSSDGTPASQFEYETRTKGGEEICLEVYASQISYNYRPAIQVAVIDKTGRKKVEDLQKKYIANLEKLSEAAMNFVGTGEDDNIYQSIADNLYNLLGNGIITVNSYNAADMTMRHRAIAGPDSIRDSIGEYLETNGGLVFRLSEERARIMLSRRFYLVPEEIFESGLSRFPLPITNITNGEIGKFITYSMGIALNNRLYGNVSITVNENYKLPDLKIIETYINMASVALQRKLAEDAYRESERRFKIALKNAPIVVYTRDKDLRYTWIYNHKVDLTSQIDNGLTLEDYGMQENADILNRLSRKAMQDKRPVTEEVRMKFHDRTLFFDIYIEPSFDREGNMTGTTGVAIDITDRKLNQEKITSLNQDLMKQAQVLSASYKELESFSFTVSHDLRAPLRAISGFSRILMEDYHDRLEEKGREYFQRIINATVNMGQLIDDLLNLARISRSDLYIEDFDLSIMAKILAHELMESAYASRQVDFVVQEGMSLRADKNLFAIALKNLIDNAIKFTSKHTVARIEIGAFNRGGQTVYYIKDDGAGFDIRYADKLFLPFHRIHSSAEFPGTGIGLAIVGKIIQRHNGTIWAESEIEKGATFYFTLGQ